MCAALGPTGELAVHAERYAAAGLEVFPVNPADKTPLVSQHRATTDTAQVDKWWRRWPTALIGHRLAADVVVLDVDPRHGGDRTWAALREAVGGWPPTRVHASGRGDGGGHVWWRRPDDRLNVRALNDFAALRDVGQELDGGRHTAGIDILHRDHRYTILPPSPHPETHQPYRWVDGRGLETPPAPMPGALADLITDSRPPEPPRPPQPRQDDSIADWYSDTHRWSELLGGHGWTLVAGDGDSDGSRWRHPAATAAYSATIRHGCLFVYSPNTAFETTESGAPHGYTPFAAYATLEHGNDQTAAARAARELKDGPRAEHPDSLFEIPPTSTQGQEDSQQEHPAITRIRSRLLFGDAIDAIPKPKPLIDDVLMLDSLALLHGKWGSGKSFVALDWALSVATGHWWHRRRVRQGKVLYVAAEGVTGLGQRRRAWMEARQVLRTDELGFYPTRINLLDAAEAAAMVAVAAELRPTLLVLDTVSRSLPGGDENSSKDMGMLIEAVDKVRQATGGTVVLVHHPPKQGTGGRGHGSLEGAVATEIGVTKAGSCVKLECLKQKDAAEFPELRLYLNKQGESCVLDCQPDTANVDEMGDTERVLLDTLGSLFGSIGATTVEWLRTSEVSERSFHRARNALVTRGLVSNLGTRARPRWVLGSDGLSVEDL